MVFTKREKIEMKHFVYSFEDSMSIDVKMVSNQHFNDVPRDIPTRASSDSFTDTQSTESNIDVKNIKKNLPKFSQHVSVSVI